MLLRLLQELWALRAGRGLFPRTGTLGSPQATLRPALPLTRSGLLREAFLWWPDLTLPVVELQLFPYDRHVPLTLRGPHRACVRFSES